MTRQIYLDGYTDAGVIVSLQLANELGPDAVQPRELVERILSFDASSLACFKPRHVSGFIALSVQLRIVMDHLVRHDIEAAAKVLNEMLAKHPAHPYLAQENGHWRLHHHPADAQLVPMYIAICAEALARMIGEGLTDRFGQCEARNCGKWFFDSSKNGTRRFCSTTCQSRTKTAAFRLRQRSSGVSMTSRRK